MSADTRLREQPGRSCRVILVRCICAATRTATRGLAAWIVLAVATQGCHGDPLTPAMRQEDPRLNQVVAIRSPHLPVGELLERLSESTGVDLKVASPPDGAGDPVLIASLRALPLYEAMDGLWALVSYRGAQWHWARNGEPGHYSYLLSRPAGARELAGNLLREQEQRFEGEATARILVAAGLISDEEYKSRLGSALGASEIGARDGFPISDAARGALGIAARALTGDQITALVSGRERITLPISSLDEKGRDFARNQYDSIKPKTSDDGVHWTPMPMPDRLHLCRANRDGAAPCLMFGLEGLGETAYSGGAPVERAMARASVARWMLPGDDAHSEREAQALPPLRVPDGRTDSGPERVLLLSDLAKVSLLMRYPLPDGPDARSVTGETLAAALAALQADPPRYAHKWRAGLLLVEWIPWYQCDDAQAPWPLYREMREACGPGGGAVPMDLLLKAGSVLTERQVRWSARLLPGGEALLQGHAELAGLAPRRRALLTEQGCLLDAGLEQALAVHLKGRFDGAGSDSRRVRIRHTPNLPSIPDAAIYTVELRMATEPWMGVVSFVSPAWRKATEYPPLAPL